jgi:hypothetical protein
LFLTCSNTGWSICLMFDTFCIHGLWTCFSPVTGSAWIQ